MRTSWDKYFMDIAFLTSSRGTCVRRKVGCVLVDSNNKVIGTGFNGTPPKWPHCNDGNPCPGAECEPGTGLDGCYANHAEVNAILNCSDVSKIRACYVTCSPCISCVKMLLCTNTTRIIFQDDYPHVVARDLWTKRLSPLGEVRYWEQYKQLTGETITMASTLST